MFIPLVEAVAETCGGKAAGLGSLLRAGLPVPHGFVVPIATFGDPLDEGALERELRALGDAPVAVRSSATDEDAAGASAAGQYESVLGVREAAQVAEAIRTCWASLSSARAVAYRTGAGEPAMAVVIQCLVDADASGVMFTRPDPAGDTVIEAAWGLGPSVVSGTVTPDSFRVSANGNVDLTVADKRTRVDRTPTGVVSSDVVEQDRRAPSLDQATASDLAKLGDKAAAVLGGPRDIEWALAGDRLWLLQARPITAAPPAAAKAGEARTTASLAGTPGSQGTATGPARVVRGPTDFPRVQPGDILVCPFTDPAWTPLLRMVAGVVTETGGMLSHAAIVAREMGIPAVLGVPGVVDATPDGALMTIDGGTGTVTSHEKP